MPITRCSSVVALLAGCAGVISAQSAGSKIPVRTLVPAVKSATDTLGSRVILRALSNGSVIVNDVSKRRVLYFDAALTKARPIVDTASIPGVHKIPSANAAASTLIRYLGDSTLYVDRATQSLLVFDEQGKLARSMALPKPQDAVVMANIATWGNPAIDEKGRLVYRANGPFKQSKPFRAGGYTTAIPNDSGIIVRADFDLRKVDTVATLKVWAGVALEVLPEDSQGNPVLKYTVDPTDFAVSDEWSVLSDGTLAVVRVGDYHIDWVDPDGTRRSSPMMPVDWRLLTDSAKQFKLDSVNPEMERARASPSPTIQTDMGPRKLVLRYAYQTFDKMRTYEVPFSTGAVMPDRDANLWILPRTSSGAKDGLLYDVINRKGELTHRVQFPAGYALAGFGDRDAVYVLRVDGSNGFLERATVK